MRFNEAASAGTVRARHGSTLLSVLIAPFAYKSGNFSTIWATTLRPLLSVFRILSIS